MKLGWNDFIRFNIRNKIILVTNTYTGQILNVSEECHSYMQHFFRLNGDVEQFLELFVDKGDQRYMHDLIKKLESMHAFTNDQFYDDMYNNLEFTWSLTNHCNLKCIHCCVSANNKCIDLSKQDLMQIADKLVDIKPAHITITGGEPLFRDDFKDIITYLRCNFKGSLSLLTNGLLINEELAEFIKDNFTNVSISIDGYDEESTSFIRGKNTFHKILFAIELLQNKGVDEISASMVVTDYTNDNIQSFSELCKKLRVRPLLRGLEQIGRGKDNGDILEIKKRNTQHIHDNEAPSKKTEPLIFTCKGALSTFLINHEGYLFPCSVLSETRFNMGNILNIESFQEYIYENKFVDTKGYKLFDSYKPYNLEHCKGCYKNLMCFHCVCDVIYALDNDIDNVCKSSNSCFDYCWER